MIKHAALLASLSLLSVSCTTTDNHVEGEPAPAVEQVQAPAPILQQVVIEAALDGKVGTIERALAQGYNVNQPDLEGRTALMYAAFNGQAAVVKKLLEAGADVNAQDKTGTSALMFAASAPGGAETVQILLDAGANINMTDTTEHFTALMWAAAEGQTENVQLLLRQGADTTLQDVDGDTAESFAASKGHNTIVSMLQETDPIKIDASKK